MSRAFWVALGLSMLSAWAGADSSSPVLVGQVVKVIDSDTIDVQLDSGPIRVRFHGSDAPERAQPHGKEATTALSQSEKESPTAAL